MKTSITVLELQQLLLEYAEAAFAITMNYNSNVTACYYDQKKITIHHAQSDVQKCISALHELGHAKQCNSQFTHLTCKAGYQALIVAQEISAWEEGWNIYNAMNLSCPSLESKYWNTAGKCVAVYIRHVAKCSKPHLAYLSTAYVKEPGEFIFTEW